MNGVGDNEGYQTTEMGGLEVRGSKKGGIVILDNWVK